MTAVAGMSVVPTMPVVCVVATMSAVVIGGLVVGPRVVVSCSGQRVGDVPAVSGHRLPVRGLIAHMATPLTVNPVVVVCGHGTAALVWPVPCPTVVVTRWSTHDIPLHSSSGIPP